MKDITGRNGTQGGLAGGGEEARSYPGQGCSWWRAKLDRAVQSPRGEAGWCLGRKADLAGRVSRDTRQAGTVKGCLITDFFFF